MGMVFTLEALQARHGDALLLHYGDAASPRLIVIDGGPSGVYTNALKPRLDEIKKARTPRDRLPIRLVLVSHIDDDHINGILELTGKLVEAQQKNQDRPYQIQGLWHNSFDDIVGNKAQELFASLQSVAVSAASSGEAPANLPLSLPGAMVVANVKQGRDLRNCAEALSLDVNKPFPGLVMAKTAGGKPVPMGGGLDFTVLGPDQERLENLQEDWDKQLKKLKLAKPAEVLAAAAAIVDTSVYNLSSLIILATAGDRRMLLTGDALGADIVAGLKNLNLLHDNKFHVDLLKMPHHGSSRNETLDFFHQVTADHYVCSADGRYDNPDKQTLEWLCEARGQDKYTLHFTNRLPWFNDFFAAQKAAGKQFTVVYRDDQAKSMFISLGDPLP